MRGLCSKNICVNFLMFSQEKLVYKAYSRLVHTFDLFRYVILSLLMGNFDLIKFLAHMCEGP